MLSLSCQNKRLNEFTVKIKSSLLSLKMILMTNEAQKKYIKIWDAAIFATLWFPVFVLWCISLESVCLLSNHELLKNNHLVSIFGSFIFNISVIIIFFFKKKNKNCHEDTFLLTLSDEKLHSRKHVEVYWVTVEFWIS